MYCDLMVPAGQGHISLFLFIARFNTILVGEGS